jgi:uncharacterized protein YdhG (YjbR/CyaY superfamily)
MKKFKNVDEYLSDLPKEQRIILEKIRKAIKETAPDAQELISYGIPGYKLNGVLIYFAGFKNHMSIYPATKGVMDKLGDKLKPFKKGAGTFQFTLDNPLPISLVKQIIKIRMKENEEREKGYN